ncbi:MAG: hypothetical protein AB7P00_28530, partial [Sandaracinaceae bacterium]
MSEPVDSLLELAREAPVPSRSEASARRLVARAMREGLARHEAEATATSADESVDALLAQAREAPIPERDPARVRPALARAILQGRTRHQQRAAQRTGAWVLVAFGVAAAAAIALFVAGREPDDRAHVASPDPAPHLDGTAPTPVEDPPRREEDRAQPGPPTHLAFRSGDQLT